MSCGTRSGRAWTAGGSRLVVPFHEEQSRGGVSGAVAAVAQLADHVHRELECVGLVSQDRGPLDEEEADGGQRVAGPEVAGVAVRLFEAVRQVLPKA